MSKYESSQTKKDYCQHCHSKTDLHKHSLQANGNYSLMCNKCNTERTKKYRQTDNGRYNIYQASKRSIEKHRHKHNARIKLLYHIKNGNIKRPKTCNHCGLDEKIFAHHKDYKKPLDVVWLCMCCHMLEHKK